MRSGTRWPGTCTWQQVPTYLPGTSTRCWVTPGEQAAPSVMLTQWRQHPGLVLILRSRPPGCHLADNLVASSSSSSCYSGLVTSSQELQSPQFSGSRIWHHWSGFKEQFLFGRLTLDGSSASPTWEHYSCENGSSHVGGFANPRPFSSCRTCALPPHSSWTSDRHRKRSAQLCNREMIEMNADDQN